MKQLWCIVLAMLLGVTGARAGAETEALAREWSGHAKPVKSMAFSPDGKLFASSSEDQTIIIRDVKTAVVKQHIPKFAQHDERLNNTPNCVAFFPDGSKLAVAYDDGRVAIWDTATGKLLQAAHVDDSGVYQVAISPDGALMATDGGAGTVRVWDLAAGTKRAEYFSPTMGRAFWTALVFSPDSSKLAGSHFTGVVKVWDMKIERERQLNRKDEAGHTTQLAFSPDGQTLAGANYNSEVKLWNIKTSELITTLEPETAGNVLGMAGVGFVHGGKSLVMAIGELGAGQVQLWDVAKGEMTRILSMEINARAMAVSADGKKVAVGTYEGPIKVYEF